MTDIQIHTLNLKGRTYEQVDADIHRLVELPETIEFHQLNERPFYGTVPKDKDSKVFEAIAFSRKNNRDSMAKIKEDYKHFRSEKFFANMFKTDKPLHGSQFKDTVIFDTSSYEDSTRDFNLRFFKELAKVFDYGDNAIEIYSILKDRSTGKQPSDRCSPFVRDHIALLIIRINRG